MSSRSDGENLTHRQVTSLEAIRDLLAEADERIIVKHDQASQGAVWYEVVYPGRGSSSVPIFVVIGQDGSIELPVAMG
jgi:hypothetical protein